MNKKRFVGAILSLIGVILIIGSQSGITGNIISETASAFGSIFGLVFIIAGMAIIFAMEEARQQTQQGDLEILISNKALDRSRKDKFIRQNIRRFAKEIQMIAADLNARPQETLGDFRISPRGKSMDGSRVAWNFDPAENKLYIEDLLYKEKENQYVDDWATKAKQRLITRRDYANSGYRQFFGL